MKISELHMDFNPKSVFDVVDYTPDPLNVTSSAHLFDGTSPEKIFARLLFKVIELLSQKCLELMNKDEDEFMVEQFSHFLMFCVYLLSSGKFIFIFL